MTFLTPGISTEDEFSDLIVNKDKETVRESAEPPAGPGGERSVFSLVSQITLFLCWNCPWSQLYSLLKRVHAQRHIHARTVGQERCQSCFLKQAKDQNLVPVRSN